MPSIIREKPGPDVAVAERAPVSAAPVAIVIAAISSSVWTTKMEAPPFLPADAQDAEGGPDREHVHDAGDLAQLVDLELVGHLLEKVLERNRHEAHAALL